jgi:hypothetical protein
VSTRLPALQFYPSDWRNDLGVQSLSRHDRMVWFDLLMLMHESERRGVLVLNGRAMSDEMIAELIHLDNQTFNQIKNLLLTRGVASLEEGTGALMNRRMVRDEDLRKIRKDAGKKGGNPVLVNQNTNQVDNHDANQKPTPSSSSSFASSKEKHNAAVASGIPVWLSKTVWDGFVEMRRRIRAPLTEAAKKLIFAKLDRWRLEGQDIEAALNQSIERGWRGIWPAEVTETNQGGANGKSNRSPAKERVDGNRRAIAEALARRGVQGPWSSPGENGAAVSESRSVDEPGGVHEGPRSVGSEVLPPRSRGRDCNATD